MIEAGMIQKTQLKSDYRRAVERAVWYHEARFEEPNGHQRVSRDCQ